MSKLKAIDNLKTGNWILNIENLAPNYADLHIGFTNEAPVIQFKNLKFGYELKIDDNIKQYGVYPPPGVRYIKTDQLYLVVKRLKLKPETTYTLFLWAQNDGKNIKKEFEFTTPRPVQPYPSWSWNGEEWISPEPYPKDGKSYTWNEDKVSWVESDKEIS